MRKYRMIAKKGEGTFSEVIKAQNIMTGTFHAIKCMKSSFKSADEVNSLREIQAIKRLSPHRNIIVLEEVLFDPPSGRLALVFELMEGNLYELMKDRSQPFSEGTIKSFMRQIFTSLDHMHGKGVFHRDIKPENILVDKLGRHLKLADFGSCRGINCKPPFTEYISTRWYRPPECLLTCGMYGMEMDVWGAGCIQFELTTLYPLFPGLDEADQIHRIHNILGTPKANVVAKLRQHAPPNANFMFPPQSGIGLSKLVPDAAESFVDLLTHSVAYDASERISSKQALKHPYFTGNISISSSTAKVAGVAHHDKSRVAKIIHETPPSKSVPSGLPKNGEHESKAGPETKHRSMVSILLARTNKKEIIEESRARNNTFYRKGGNKSNDVMANSDKVSHGISLPKLKSLIPENSLCDENKKHLKPTELHHKRTCNSYGPTMLAPPASKLASIRESDPVAMRERNHNRGLVSKPKLNRSKLPPLRRDLR